MSAPMQQSIRSLANDRVSRPLRWLLIAITLIAAWFLWFSWARVSVYAVSANSRIVVEHDAHSIEAPVSGKLVQSNLVLDQWIEKGSIVIQLDTSQLEFELAAKRGAVENLLSQVSRLKSTIGLKVEALELMDDVMQTQVAEAQARHRSSSALADSARERVERSAKLRERALVSESDYSKVQAEGQATLASTNALKVAVARIEAEGQLQHSEITAELAELKHDLQQIEGNLAQERFAIDSLLNDIDERSIRAPIKGRLGEIARVNIGSVIAAGDRIAMVVPSGKFRVAAYFTPDIALGRVHQGQTARLRLDGFPWSEFGTVPLSVASVGSEVGNGRIRVMLDIIGDLPPQIPEQHGLPGSVEVEVERVSPAELVLRVAGRALDGPQTDVRATNKPPWYNDLDESP